MEIYDGFISIYTQYESSLVSLILQREQKIEFIIEDVQMLTNELKYKIYQEIIELLNHINRVTGHQDCMKIKQELQKYCENEEQKGLIYQMRTILRNKIETFQLKMKMSEDLNEKKQIQQHLKLLQESYLKVEQNLNHQDQSLQKSISHSSLNLSHKKYSEQSDSLNQENFINNSEQKCKSFSNYLQNSESFNKSDNMEENCFSEFANNKLNQFYELLDKDKQQFNQQFLQIAPNFSLFDDKKSLVTITNHEQTTNHHNESKSKTDYNRDFSTDYIESVSINQEFLKKNQKSSFNVVSSQNNEEYFNSKQNSDISDNQIFNQQIKFHQNDQKRQLDEVDEFMQTELLVNQQYTKGIYEHIQNEQINFEDIKHQWENKLSSKQFHLNFILKRVLSNIINNKKLKIIKLHFDKWKKSIPIQEENLLDSHISFMESQKKVRFFDDFSLENENQKLIEQIKLIKLQLQQK